MTDKRPCNFELLWLMRLAFRTRASFIAAETRSITASRSSSRTSPASDYAWDRGDLVFIYRQYERLMDHWRRVLSADRFTEVDYETLVADRRPRRAGWLLSAGWTGTRPAWRLSATAGW